MTTQNRLAFFATTGFGVVLLAMQLSSMAVHWRGLLMIAGGWLMAVGVLYQVELYSYDKNSRYYVLIAFAGIFWICMTVITLFWLGILLGVV